MHSRLSIVVLFFLIAVVIAHVQSAPTTKPTDMPKIPLASFDRAVLATSRSHVLWYSSELIEATRGNRVQSFTLRYYLQAIGEADASLIHQEVVHGRSPRGFILADGSVAILIDNVLWIDPNTGEKRHEAPTLDGERAGCIMMYPDGAVLQAIHWGLPPGTPTPAFWVPVKDGAFDYEAKWSLSGDRGLSSPLKFGRSGDTLVWIGPPPSGDQPIDEGAHLFVADLGKQAIATRALPFHAKGGYLVEAFDGRTVFSGSYFIDIATGEVTKAVSLSPLGMIEGRLFGIRQSDEGRRDDEVSLLYVDVDRPTEVSTLATFKRQEGGPGLEHSNEMRLRNAFLVHNEHVLVWDGTTWTTWRYREHRE